MFPWAFCVWGGVLAASTPNPVRPKTSFPHSVACRMLSGPNRHRLAAMAPKLLWLGKNLWHVLCCLLQAMIHGVFGKCFVLGPRGHFIRGSPISLPVELLPLALSPLLSVLTPSAARHRYSPRDPAAAFLVEVQTCA